MGKQLPTVGDIITQQMGMALVRRGCDLSDERAAHAILDREFPAGDLILYFDDAVEFARAELQRSRTIADVA